MVADAITGNISGEATPLSGNIFAEAMRGPFIDLLSRSEYSGAQLIITGASFSGLKGVHRRELTHVYVS